MKFGRNTAAVMPERARGPDWGKSSRPAPHVRMAGSAPQPTFQTACLGRVVRRSEHHSFTGVRMGAPLALSSTTTNLAGSVLLALRPTT
jgi:hypothetical protein